MEREGRRRGGAGARRGGRGDRPGDLDRARRRPTPARRGGGARRQGPAGLPLFGVPFAVKDNIDVAGLPTTAACPAFAYLPERSATAVERLRAAGALLIGKTNLDQFATGLVGVRSPYGAPRSPFDSRYVSGGSSSGSAVAVSRGLVNFALGTDTAGSGRVPAAFCNLIGLKPSRGLISAAGVVPACQSLDCVSIFATNADDAAAALAAAAGFDAADPYSRAPLTPIDGAAAGRAQALPLRRAARRRSRPSLATRKSRRCSPRPCERLSAPRRRSGRDRPHAVLRRRAPALRRAVGGRAHGRGRRIPRRPSRRRRSRPSPRIISKGREVAAPAAFDALHRLEAQRRECEAGVAPDRRPAYADDADRLHGRGGARRSAEAQRQPRPLHQLRQSARPRRGGGSRRLRRERPAGRRHADRPDAFRSRAARARRRATSRRRGDRRRARPAAAPARPARRRVERRRRHRPRRHRRAYARPAAQSPTRRSRRPLHRPARTAAIYRLVALSALDPPNPGMVRVEKGGAAVECEIWRLPAAAFGAFVASVEPPHAIGKVALDDGRWLPGFLCESRHGRDSPTSAPMAAGATGSPPKPNAARGRAAS